jgi:hypothetical protein
MSIILFATRTWDGFTSGRVPCYHVAQKKELISKICIPRTSSLTSSYSAPASLHLRCSALQNATTSITSDGDAPELISLSKFPLVPEGQGKFKTPFFAINASMSVECWLNVG